MLTGLEPDAAWTRNKPGGLAMAERWRSDSVKRAKLINPDRDKRRIRSEIIRRRTFGSFTDMSRASLTYLGFGSIAEESAGGGIP